MDRNLINRLSIVTDEEKAILSGLPLKKNIYTSDMDFVIDYDKLTDDKRDILVRPHTRFADFPHHKHNYLEMMIVLSGEITHRIFDESLTLSEGDILIMNKHVSHSIDKAWTNDIGVNVIISDDFVERLLQEVSKTAFSELAQQNLRYGGDGIYLCFSTRGNKQLENIVENLLFELLEYYSDSNVLKYTVSLLFNYLSRNTPTLLRTASKMPDRASKRKAAISEYIASKYKTATLRELSEIMFLSMPYLSRLIVEYFGKSFKELLFEQRMNVATELVIKTRLPIGDIISSVGYENESYFHREFKRKNGKTPLMMRRDSQG